MRERHGVGEATIREIADELKKPGRDPRDGYPKPIMQKGVVTFEDLREGMMITGKIKNVVDFGAFVDLGIKETALVHVSEMSDRFVKDPMDAVKVGDVLEFRIISLDGERRRIGLSRKSENAQRVAGGAGVAGGGAGKEGGAVKVGERRPAVVGRGGKPGFEPREQRGGGRNARDDDGSTYNPFAEAFKKKAGK